MPRRAGLAEEQYDDLILNTPNLVGYWPLNEFSGTIAHNLSPKSGAGTYTGTYKLGAKGPSADSSFDSNDTGYVSIANDADLHTNTSQSCEAWINFTGKTGWDVILSIVSYTAGTGWFLLYNGSRLVWSKAGDEAAGGVGYNFTPTNGRWYHVVMAYDSVATDAWMYLDGILRGTSAHPISATPTTNAVAMFIGARLTNAGGTPPVDFFDGRICRVAYYNGRALTHDEVRAHYEAGIA